MTQIKAISLNFHQKSGSVCL